MRFSLDPPFSFSFFSSLLFLSLLTLLAVPAAGTVLPSNTSADLSWTNNLRFRLSGHIHLPSNVTLAPLTEYLVNLSPRKIKTFNVTGNLVDVSASNSVSLGSSDLAFITCDSSAYPGELDASETVANVITQNPPAIVLYSTTHDHCNYSADDASGYPDVFTLVNRDSANTVKSHLSSEDHKEPASIVADMSFVSATGPPSDGGPPGGSSDSPNTAMIILYSITGIITALFLGIIITGAVRAHRHPERYGPRYTAGRPRQSRARGIARAMVETIPIVKFGDADEGKPDVVKSDIELAVDPEERREHSPERPKTADGERTPEEEAKNPNTDTNEGKPTTDPTANTPPDADASNFSCPICTDDFVKGQDIRVLPCNHNFHPECIDPWLVNVSGTCPLCRIDLNPEHAGENEEGEGAEPQDGEAAPGPGEHQNHQSRRLTTYLQGPLNARRMRDATVEERLAALRSVRAVSREEEPAESEEGQGRRNRLTTRLRERFRIRTRAHERDPS